MTVSKSGRTQDFYSIEGKDTVRRGEGVRAEGDRERKENGEYEEAEHVMESGILNMYRVKGRDVYIGDIFVQ